MTQVSEAELIFIPIIKGFNLPAYNIFQGHFVAKLLRHKSGVGIVSLLDALT